MLIRDLTDRQQNIIAQIHLLDGTLTQAACQRRVILIQELASGLGCQGDANAQVMYLDLLFTDWKRPSTEPAKN